MHFPVIEIQGLALALLAPEGAVVLAAMQQSDAVQSTSTDFSNPADWLMVGVTAVLTLITTAMASIAYIQARISRNQNLTAILLQFLDTYSSDKMLESLAELRNYRNNNSEDLEHLRCLYRCTYNDTKISEKTIEVAKIYNEEKEPNVGRGGIGEHRARVAWFFSKIWRLNRYEFLNNKTMKTLCSLDGVGVFLEVAVPLTLAIRYVKIHNCDEVAFKRDPNVQWFRDVEKIHDSERPDLKKRRY